jgi:hypothetical protein
MPKTFMPYQELPDQRYVHARGVWVPTSDIKATREVGDLDEERVAFYRHILLYALQMGKRWSPFLGKLWIRSKNNEYNLNDGHHRLQAAQDLGVTAVFSDVYSIDDIH